MIDYDVRRGWKTDEGYNISIDRNFVEMRMATFADLEFFSWRVDAAAMYASTILFFTYVIAFYLFEHGYLLSAVYSLLTYIVAYFIQTLSPLFIGWVSRIVVGVYRCAAKFYLPSIVLAVVSFFTKDYFLLPVLLGVWIARFIFEMIASHCLMRYFAKRYDVQMTPTDYATLKILKSVSRFRLSFVNFVAQYKYEVENGTPNEKPDNITKNT